MTLPLPTVPATVWEQIPVIVIFSILLVSGAWMMVKAFSKAVADINAHYTNIIERNNAQWQKYFDDRSETNTVVNDQVVEKLGKLTSIIEKLVLDFEKHDAVELGLLEKLASGRFTRK